MTKVFGICSVVQRRRDTLKLLSQLLLFGWAAPDCHLENSRYYEKLSAQIRFIDLDRQARPKFAIAIFAINLFNTCQRLSLHVTSLSDFFPQKLTSWVFNDQPCECADVGRC